LVVYVIKYSGLKKLKNFTRKACECGTESYEEGKREGLLYGIIPAFTCRDWGNLRKPQSE